MRIGRVRPVIQLALLLPPTSHRSTQTQAPHRRCVSAHSSAPAPAPSLGPCTAYQLDRTGVADEDLFINAHKSVRQAFPFPLLLPSFHAPLDLLSTPPFAILCICSPVFVPLQCVLLLGGTTTFESGSDDPIVMHANSLLLTRLEHSCQQCGLVGSALACIRCNKTFHIQCAFLELQKKGCKVEAAIQGALRHHSCGMCPTSTFAFPPCAR